MNPIAACSSSICSFQQWITYPVLVEDITELSTDAVSAVNYLECLKHCRSAGEVSCLYASDGDCDCLRNFTLKQFYNGTENIGSPILTESNFTVENGMISFKL